MRQSCNLEWVPFLIKETYIIGNGRNTHFFRQEGTHYPARQQWSLGHNKMHYNSLISTCKELTEDSLLHQSFVDLNTDLK